MPETGPSFARSAPRTAFYALCAVLIAALSACGGKKDKTIERYEPIELQESERLRINAYLWRAALDTLDFMAIASTDATGGIILTEWYINPALPNERMKVTVRILDPHLRSDALNVGVVREVRGGQGSWLSAPVKAGTVARMEDAILLRARQIRMHTIVE